MNIKTVTITGADDNTDLASLKIISKKYPFVEWGILFSKDRTGTEKYPSLYWIQEVSRRINSDIAIKFSAHICGEYTREILRCDNSFLVHLYYHDLVKMFSRFQLNYNASKYEYDVNFPTFIKDSTVNYIVQQNKANEKLNESLKGLDNVHFLYDSSGGRGVLNSKWRKPLPNNFTGYAGGLNPDNLEDELKKIADVAEGHTIWIDVESGVRTYGKLDLCKVERFLHIASKYVITEN